MHLTRTEPDANLHRFYHMEIARGLFGDWGLVPGAGADRLVRPRGQSQGRPLRVAHKEGQTRLRVAGQKRARTVAVLTGGSDTAKLLILCQTGQGATNDRF